MYGRGFSGLGLAFVPTSLDPSDPNNPNRALYMEASSASPALIADALNSGDPYTMQRAIDNMFWWPADSGHHAGLMTIQGLTLFTPSWFSTLNAAAKSAVLAGMQANGFGDPGTMAAIQGGYTANQVDPTAMPPGWILGEANGTQGYWSPDGRFFAGTTPWLNPSAVGLTLAQVSPPPAQSNAPQTPVQTNPDGTPTYNGQKYSATDKANPYNQPGYVPGGQIGPAVPGGSVSGPFVPTGQPESIPATVNAPPTVTSAMAPAQASVLGGMSSSTLLLIGGGLLVGLLLLRGRSGGSSE